MCYAADSAPIIKEKERALCSVNCILWLVRCMKHTNTEKVKRLSVAAMFTGLAFLVTVVFHIKVANFLTFELKDAVMTIGGMICGPVYALGMSLAAALLEFLTISTTGLYGLVMNFISSLFFTLPACLIYKYNRTMKGAAIGIVTSIFSMTAVMMVANLLITPLYYGMHVSKVVEMLPTLLLPFNLTKATLNAGMVLLLYKPVTGTLRKAKLLAPADTTQIGVRKRTVWTVVIALLMIAVSLLVFFLMLGGKISIGIDK